MPLKVLASLLSFLLLLVSCANSDLQRADLATIVKVVDGDTVVVKIQNKIETLRLIGVDTPETVHPTKGVECFGPQASGFTKMFLEPGLMVKLLRDIEPRDRYQRLLVYLFLPDGKFFNQMLVEQGFARTLNIEPNSAFSEQLASHESSARNRRVGLWLSCER